GMLPLTAPPRLHNTIGTHNWLPLNAAKSTALRKSSPSPAPQPSYHTAASPISSSACGLRVSRRFIQDGTGAGPEPPPTARLSTDHGRVPRAGVRIQQSGLLSNRECCSATRRRYPKDPLQVEFAQQD